MKATPAKFHIAFGSLMNPKKERILFQASWLSEASGYTFRKLTCPLKGVNSKGKDHLPTTISQGTTLSFRWSKLREYKWSCNPQMVLKMDNWGLFHPEISGAMGHCFRAYLVYHPHDSTRGRTHQLKELDPLRGVKVQSGIWLFSGWEQIVFSEFNEGADISHPWSYCLQ